MNYLLATVLTAVLVGAVGGAAGSLKERREWLQRQDDGDWIFDNGWYLLRFAKKHGYAGIEVRISAGSGRRLDQYWPNELTFAPMCRMFDNVSFMDADGGEIQGFLTMENGFVEARATTIAGQPALVQEGYLQRRGNGTRGHVRFEKRMVFYDDHYDAELSVRVPAGSQYRYADVWFDINDEWCRRYTNSAGDIIRLRRGIADAEDAHKTHRTIAELDRGYGVWMSVSGLREEILIAITSPDVLKPLPHAGITFFDGPTEVDPEADKYQSHECMAISVIGGLLTPVPMEPNELAWRYSVYFLARQDFEVLYGTQ